MPILTENVKLMASQRLTDQDDGGGRMTGNEIVDGNVNNLFPDISRLDRVYGRVSLRKGFISIQTADTAIYSGSHIILSAPAKDPNVSVCMFSTSDPNDERTAARNRLESYVTVGPRYQGWLWGDQPAGSRSILIFQIKGGKMPDIGSVLYLVNDKGLATEKSQFVRITKVELSSAEFTALSDSSEYGAQAMAFKRDILKVEIGDPLRETFKGIEISQNDSLATNVYTTTVSDAAKYYGVMLPTTPILENDIAINVDSIFAHLVPSAQGEAPMIDLSVGEAGPVIGSGASYSINVASALVNNGRQIHFGRGIKPLSLTIVSASGGHTYTDKGDGILYEGTAQCGTVDYSLGVVTFANLAASYTSALTVSAIIGVEAVRCPNTLYKFIELANRGYNYTAILDPLPVRGSVWVDYMSQGKWYRLRDNGMGFLTPDIINTGTGSINYATGSLILTCGALPDADTVIIFNWANPIETVDLSGLVTVDVAEINHTLAVHPVKPGSLIITWPTGVNSTATATDNGTGLITGGATGWINYATGEIAFKPALLPVAGGEYEIDFEKYPEVAGASGVNQNGLCTFTLPSCPIKPRSVSINCIIAFSSYQHVYNLRDDGDGHLSAPGWAIDVPVSHPTWPGHTEANGIIGTIDYITGVCQVDLTDVEGLETWKQPYVQTICTLG